MTDKEKEKEKKGLWERYLEWGYKPYKVLAKSVVGGIKEGASDEEKSAEDSIAILKLRLAKGEITTEQYEELKKTIENK